MRKTLLMLGVLALICSPAMAGKNAGGSMIVHTNDAVVYTGSDDYCGAQYDDPGTCETAGTQTDLLDRAAVVWFLAAFHETSNPGVTVCYFGNNHNLPAGWITALGFCGPDGSLEIPDTGWPDNPATAGNSVAFGSPIVGNHLFPFYWFAVWGQDGNTYFGTGINPTGGYAGFVSDDNPGVLDETDRFGTVRWLSPGENMCPEPPAATGACCYADGTCEVVAPADCAGDYLGDNTVCDPNPCPQPGACCFEDGTCAYVLEEDCMGQGGDWYGGTCDPNPCPQPPTEEACCFEDGSCTMLLADECTAQGGVPQGPDTVCDPNPCPQPPPLGACCYDDAQCVVTTEEDCDATYNGYLWIPDEVCDPNPCPPVATETTTWGSIKADYR